MIIRINRIVFHEMVHWIWLWVLAGIIITALQSSVSGADWLPKSTDSSSIIETENVTLGDVLLLHHRGEHQQVIKAWQQIDLARDSITWRHVGIGVAEFRLGKVDQATEQLTRAIQANPNNAVAEYFLGRVCQAKSRSVPFWYEADNESPFRLIGTVQDRRGPILPQYRTIPLDKQARDHFRRAIQLSDQCPLDRVIEIEQPVIRLVHEPATSEQITVGDLLVSLGEESYVDKARNEISERLVEVH